MRRYGAKVSCAGISDFDLDKEIGVRRTPYKVERFRGKVHCSNVAASTSSIFTIDARPAT